MHGKLLRSSAALLAFLGLVEGGMAASSLASGGKPRAFLTGPATGEFGFDFFRQLVKTGGYRARGDANLAFSPFSLACVLEELRLGASGEAEKALDAALHAGESWAGPASAITKPGALDSKGMILSVANSLWLGERFQPKQEFLASANEAFGNTVFTIDFGQSADAVKRINGWIADKTGGHIKNLLSARDFSKATAMAIGNAVYFKGQWKTPFDERDTLKQPFHLLSGKEVPVPTMNRGGKFGFAVVDEVALLEIPYGSGAVSMVLLLPKPGPAGMAHLETLLREAWFTRAVGSLAQQTVTVAVPKFTFSFEPENLIGLLKTLGLDPIFHPSLDFAKISDKQPMAVDLFKHRAWLEVNEKGTEATAVTVTGMQAMAMPIMKRLEFIADRPFLFLILHKATGTPLFLGRVSDPAKKN